MIQVTDPVSELDEETLAVIAATVAVLMDESSAQGWRLRSIHRVDAALPSAESLWSLFGRQQQMLKRQMFKRS
mgnify:CR=1 FL=1